MRELLSKSPCLSQPEPLAYSPNEFLELLEPGIDYHVQLLGRFTPSSINSGQQIFKSLSEPLQNKFLEWTTKLEDVQKHCPEWQKLHLAKKVKNLSMILDHVYDVYTTLDLDNDLERDLTTQMELLIHNHTKIDPCQQLSEENLQVLADIETMISQENWQNVLNNTSEVVGDSNIQNHHTSENLQNSQPVKDVETLETILKNCNIGQQEEIPKNTVAEEIPQNKVVEDIPQNKVVEDIPQNKVVEDIPQNTVAEEIPQNTVAEEIPQNTVAEEIPQNTVAEEIPQNTVAEEMPQNILPVAEGEVLGTSQQVRNKNPQNKEKTICASHSRPIKRKSDIKICGNNPPKVAASAKPSPAKKNKKYVGHVEYSTVGHTSYNNRRKEAEIIDLISSDEDDEKANHAVPEPKIDQSKSKQKVKKASLRRSPRFSDRGDA